MSALLVRVWLLALAALLAAGFVWTGWFAGRSKWATTPSYARVSILAFVSLAPLTYAGLLAMGAMGETYVRFATPQALPLVAALALVAAVRFSRLSPRGSPWRRRVVTVLMSMALLGASLVIAEPEVGRPLDRMTVVVAVDRSRSVDLVPGSEQRIAAELRLAEESMHSQDRIARVVFGAEAATEDPARIRTDLPSSQRVSVGRDGTDLERVIRHALAELPPDTSGRVVLVTDGVQTRGDALTGATAAMGLGVPVDVVVLEQRMSRDVRVVTVRAPARAGMGEPLELRVVTASANSTDVEVRLKRDGAVIRRARARIGAGEDTLRVREVADEPGLHRYDVELSALDPSADETPEDNVGSVFVRVRGPSRALVLEGESANGGALVNALELAGIHAEARGVTGVPADLGEFGAYDLVSLSNIRASDLSPEQLQALGSYAKDMGGGLLLMGGDRAFGPGGYASTPVEEVSPVRFDLKEQKRRASLAEVILIDYSGSMGAEVGGQTKLALANEAAARSAALLGEGDLLGVAHVDTLVKWTVPLGPVKESSAVGTEIRKTAVGGGGIYTDLALRAGYAALDRERVNLKHVLLFADGSDAEQIVGCRGIVKAAFERGITTSVISLGKGGDTPELEALSRAGMGRFYLIEDATRLPAVFSQETILASKGAISEKPFHVSVGSPTPATRGIDFGKAPALEGYVITVAKPRATVGLRGPEGDPIYATWSVGLGRASAFLSDFSDRWGHRWLKWEGGAKFFAQVVSDISRRQDDPNVRLESDASGGELHVRADVLGDDGRAQSFRRLMVHVAGPGGFSRELALEAVGAGRYAATLPLSRPGTYLATARDEASGEKVGTSGAVLTTGEEMRPTGSDRILLSKIAMLTGGKVRESLAGLYDDRAARRFAYQSITWPLALLSALALLLSVVARRLGTPEWLLAVATLPWTWIEQRRQTAQARTHAREEAHLRATELDRTNRELILASRRRLDEARARGVLPAGRALPLPAPHPAATQPTDVTPAPVVATPGTTSPTPAPVATERPLTSVERLALKRRERK